MRSRFTIDWSDDRGQAGWEVLPFGVLVFVIGTLMVANLWAVVDAKMATNAAAREAVRVVAESRNEDEAYLWGRDSAEKAYEVFGRSGSQISDFDIDFESDDGAPINFQRCALATVQVTYTVSLINLPVIDSSFGPEPFEIISRHSEIVDPYSERVEVQQGRCYG